MVISAIRGRFMKGYQACLSIARLFYIPAFQTDLFSRAKLFVALLVRSMKVAMSFVFGRFLTKNLVL